MSNEAFTKFSNGMLAMLREYGEDPNRDGLLETPHRVWRAWGEFLEGYRTDVDSMLNVQFDLEDETLGSYDQMIISGPIPFVSMCEHHMLPFEGKAWVGYIPNAMTGRVVGLSKLARLVEAYARRLQVQERMTQQIAAALERNLAPLGCGVVLRAAHTCQSYRGVRKASLMTTSAMHGVLRDSSNQARMEFMELIHNGG